MFRLAIVVAALLVLLVVALPVWAADDCQATARFNGTWPANDDHSRWNIKFTIVASGCEMYGCHGVVEYTGAFSNQSGEGSKRSGSVPFRIAPGNSSTEVIDSSFPAVNLVVIRVDDAQIKSVTCSVP